jgi:hypothetical protein
MIYPIPPGLTCVPSAVCALTGAPADAVVVPALNRHDNSNLLLAAPGGLPMAVAEAALKEMGKHVLKWKHLDFPRKKLHSWVSDYTESAYPLLLATNRHALVAYKGLVYDTFSPIGCSAKEHPYANHIITYVSSIR